MAGAPIVVQGKEAGELYIPALGKTIKQVEWREDDIFDTVQLASGAQTSGNQLEFFKDLSNKNVQHTNLKTARRLSSGSELLLTRVGLIVNQAFGNTIVTPEDQLKIGYGHDFRFQINERLIVEGPVMKFQSGYGMIGQINDNASNTKSGSLTTGVASQAAAPTLLVTQPVKDDDDLFGYLTSRAMAWASPTTLATLVAACTVSCFLHGILKRPVGK